MVIERNGRNGLSWGIIVPWFIAIISLTFVVADRLNIPVRETAAWTGEFRELKNDVKWLKENVNEMRGDLKRHVETER